MYLLAPFIFAVLFMILVAFSSCIFKIIFKIKSFVGFGSGICCSILTDVIASIYTVVVLVAIMSNLVDDAQKMANNASATAASADPNKLLNYTKGGLFLLWLFLTVLMGIVFIFIFFFTKRISKPEDDYNSVFMFISGYILLPFLGFYLTWMIVTAGINSAIEQHVSTYGSEEEAAAQAVGTLGTFFFTLIDFVGLLVILLFAGTIIMCMLHHRKVNSLIIFICIGCFFSPAIFTLIFFFTFVTFFITYMLILPSCASIGLGIFFYLRYAVEGSSTTGYAQPQASYQLAS